MDHGTYAGFHRHRRAGEPACEPCRLARNAYHNAWAKKTGNARRKGRRKRYPATPRQNRRKNWKRHGIDPDAAEKALTAHGGRCEICLSTDSGPRDWAVDHDKRREPNAPPRGILCVRCNAGLGFFREDRKIMEAAISYLFPVPNHRTQV